MVLKSYKVVCIKCEYIFNDASKAKMEEVKMRGYGWDNYAKKSILRYKCPNCGTEVALILEFGDD